MSREMYKAARRYGRRGWITTPLSSPKSDGKKPGKEPFISRWQLKTKIPSEEQIKKWYLNTKDYNIGLLCGKVNNITVLDFDSFVVKDELFEGIDIDNYTLWDKRKAGRGHFIFKYTTDVDKDKINHPFLRLLGVEVLNDRHQIAIPPSIHEEGQTYKWVNDGTPIRKMPKKVIKRIYSLVEKVTRLDKIISKCNRSWIRDIWADKVSRKDKQKDKEKRVNLYVRSNDAMLPLATELKANGCSDDDFHTFAKIMLEEDYDKKQSSKRWKSVDPKKTWKLETLKSKLPSHLRQYVINEMHSDSQGKFSNTDKEPEPKNLRDAFYQYVLFGRDSQKFKIGEMPNNLKMEFFEEYFNFSSIYKKGLLHVTIYVKKTHTIKIMHVSIEKETFTYNDETEERKFSDNTDDIIVRAYLYHCRKYGFPWNNERLFGRNDEYKIRLFQECSKTSCGLSKQNLVWRIKKKIDGKYQDTGIHLPSEKKRSNELNRKLIKKLYFKKEIKNAKLISLVLHLNVDHTQRIIRRMRSDL